MHLYNKLRFYFFPIWECGARWKCSCAKAVASCGRDSGLSAGSHLPPCHCGQATSPAILPFLYLATVLGYQCGGLWSLGCRSLPFQGRFEDVVSSCTPQMPERTDWMCPCRPASFLSRFSWPACQGNSNAGQPSSLRVHGDQAGMAFPQFPVCLYPAL